MRRIFFIFSLSVSLVVNANWEVDKKDDPFSGNSIKVYSYDKNKKGFMYFSNENYILINNGDSYICTNPNYSSYRYIDILFKVDDEIFSQKFAISDNNQNLIYREDLIRSGLTISISDFTKTFSKRMFANRGIDIKKFTNALKSSSILLIRTNDGCGNQINLEFEMSGFSEAINALKY